MEGGLFAGRSFSTVQTTATARLAPWFRRTHVCNGPNSMGCCDGALPDASSVTGSDVSKLHLANAQQVVYVLDGLLHLSTTECVQHL